MGHIDHDQRPPERLVATASWMASLAASWQERLQLLKQMAEAGTDPGPDLGWA